MPDARPSSEPWSGRSFSIVSTDGSVSPGGPGRLGCERETNSLGFESSQLCGREPPSHFTTLSLGSPVCRMGRQQSPLPGAGSRLACHGEGAGLGRVSPKGELPVPGRDVVGREVGSGSEW